MTIAFIKNKRCQTLLINGLEDPPPPLYWNVEIEVLDSITVVLCSED